MPKKSKFIRKNIRQRGWGLTETLLTIGALSIMSVAIYTVFKPTSATAQVRIEQDNLRDISRNIDRSFGMLGSFEGLTTDRVSDEGLAPSRMERAGGHLQTDWGTEATVQPYENPAKGITSNTAFSVVYPGTPGEVCSGLSSAMARDAFDILVNGESIYDTSGMSPSLASQRCADGDATMEFVFHSGLVAGQAVASPPLVLPPAPPSVSRPPTTPPVMDIPDNPGVADATPGVIPSPPAAPSSPPPAPPPVSPPPSVTPPDPIVIEDPPPPPVTPPGTMCDPSPAALPNQTQRRDCPEGYLGDIHEARTRTQNYTCPEAWDNPQPSHVSYGAWTETSNTCAPECVAPTDTSTNITRPASDETQNVACPAGEEGTHTQSRTRQERGTRTTSWTCPAATGSPTSSTKDTWSGTYNYGDWTTTSNTCAPVSSCEWYTDTSSPFLPGPFPHFSESEFSEMAQSHWKTPAGPWVMCTGYEGVVYENKHWTTWPGGGSTPSVECNAAVEGLVHYSKIETWTCNVMLNTPYSYESQTRFTCSCEGPPPPPPATECIATYNALLSAGRVFTFIDGVDIPGGQPVSSWSQNQSMCTANSSEGYVTVFTVTHSGSIRWIPN